MSQMSIFDMMYDKFTISNQIRLIELFAGYGSQAMALRNLGGDYVSHKVVEIDKYSVASYNKIHSTDFVPLDICQIHGKDLNITDLDKYTYIMTYSFPCTSISIAGRMEGMEKDSGTASSLLWEVKRIMGELAFTDSLPQVLLMENVTQVHSGKNMKEYEKWLDYLTKLGYTNYGKDLNAWDFGLPQHRERHFLLSLHGNYAFTFPEPMELNKCLNDFLEPLTEELANKQICRLPKAKALLEELNEEKKLA